MTDNCTVTRFDDCLLHRIDPDAGVMVFVPTTRSALSHASFVDGRTPFATGPVRTQSQAAACTVAPPVTGPPRYILHMGFCGSTLLSRLLDVPGQAFVLKEPNALADIANWQARCAERGSDDQRIPKVADYATAMLLRHWAPNKPVVVKPSNWVNNIAEQLAADARAVIATIAPRAFVTAIFRGGRERMLFASRAFLHLAQGRPAFQRLFAEATANAGPFEKVARVAALLHAVQTALLARIPDATRIDFQQICREPDTAVAEACRALALPRPDARLAAQRAATVGRNAKLPGLSYSSSEHARADLQVHAQHGPVIDAALEWVASRINHGAALRINRAA